MFASFAICVNFFLVAITIIMATSGETGESAAPIASSSSTWDNFNLEDFIIVHKKVPLDQYLMEGEDASPALSNPAAVKPVVPAPATKRPDFRKGRRLLPILEEVNHLTAATTLAATSPMTWVTVAPPPPSVGRWQPAAAEIVALSLGIGLLVCLWPWDILSSSW